jgi:hypothetical protein
MVITPVPEPHTAVWILMGLFSIFACPHWLASGTKSSKAQG